MNKKYNTMKMKLTESKLRKIIAESVRKIVLENNDFDEAPNSWYDMDDEYMAQDRENAEIVHIPINLLEEIFPGEYDSDRIVDGNEISYEFDEIDTPEEKANFFNYCKKNEDLFNTTINIYDYDDGWDVESITNEEEIINYISKYPNKKFVKYFMNKLAFIKRDGAEYYRFYNMQMESKNNKLKKIVAESVKKVLSEASYDRNGN